MARVGLAIERLRGRSRPANIAELQDLQFKFAACGCHLQHVANPDLARGLRWLSVGLISAQVAGPRGQGARLKKSGCPKPFIHSHRSHDLLPISLASIWASKRI